MMRKSIMKLLFSIVLVTTIVVSGVISPSVIIFASNEGSGQNEVTDMGEIDKNGEMNQNTNSALDITANQSENNEEKSTRSAPTDNPVTYHAISTDTIVAANGNPIIITQGSTSTTYHVYYDYGTLGVLDEEDVEVDLSKSGATTGSLADGFAFKTVVGGSVDKPCNQNTHVTLWNCTGTGIIAVSGGGFVSRTSTSSSTNANVTGDTTVIIDNGDNAGVIANLIGGGFTLGDKSTKAGRGTAEVQGNTNIIMRSGKVTNLYGGGFSQSAESTLYQKVNISGNTNIKIENGAVSYIYGGSYSRGLKGGADVNGTANIIINGGNISEAVYGGGKSAPNTTPADKNDIITNAVNIVINDGTVKNVIGGGFINSTASTPIAGSVTIQNDVQIKVNNGTITGYVQGGGSVESISSVASNAKVLGNTYIIVNDGIFTSEKQTVSSKKYPTIIGGGSATSNVGFATVEGSTYIEVNGGKFNVPASECSNICGGGVIANDGVYKDGGAGVNGNSTVIITGGVFEAPILIGGKESSYRDTAVKGTATLKIKGGTIKEVDVGAVAESDKVQVDISGGSIDSIPEKLLDSSLYKTTITLKSMSGEPANTAEIGDIEISDKDYGVKDLYTDQDGKLYLYLKEGTTVKDAVLKKDSKKYKGSITVSAINVNKADFINDNYTPVKDITLLSGDTIYSWLPYELETEITPNDATYREIQWQVSDDSEISAKIEGKNVTITDSGTLKLKAVIENGASKGTPFTKEFIFQAIYKPIINGGLIFESSTTNGGTFYANGNPVLITKGKKGLNFYYDYGVIGELDEADDWINLNDLESFTDKQKEANEENGFVFSKAPIIYGGGLNTPVDKACITVLDGEIEIIYAGGKRTIGSIDVSDRYSVKNNTVINLLGGSVNTVYGGGYVDSSKSYSPIYYSQVKLSTINLGNAKVKKIYGGGNHTGNQSDFQVDDSIINIESGDHADLYISTGTSSSQNPSNRSVLTSNININGGNFGGEINRCEKSQKSPIISYLTINGGIVGGKIWNKMTMDTKSKIYITGGSVTAVDNSGNSLTAYQSKQQSSIRVYKTELNIEDGANLSINQLNTNLLTDYGLHDVKTDENGKLTVYLPMNTHIKGVVSGESSYISDADIIVNTNGTATGILKEQKLCFNSIIKPMNITGYSKGQDVTEMGLPEVVEIITDEGTFKKVKVIWKLDECEYKKDYLGYQQFEISGTVQLPSNIVNTNNRSLEVKIKVTLLAQLQDTSPGNSGIIVSGNIDITQKELQVNEIFLEDSAYTQIYEQLKQSLGEEYTPIGAYEINLISKLRSNAIDVSNQYEITFTVDEKYNDKVIVVKQLTEDMVKTMKAKAINGKVTITTSDLTYFMLGAPLRFETTVKNEAELRDAVEKAAKTPTTIYLADSFTVTSTGNASDTIKICDGADIVIINESDSDSLTLNRPQKNEPVIHVEKGGKLSFKSSTAEPFTLNLSGKSDLAFYSYSNILNEGELMFDNINIDIYDEAQNTIHSKGILKMDHVSLTVIASNQTYQNLWGAVLLEGEKSETTIAYSRLGNATCGPVLKAEKINSLNISNTTIENNGGNTPFYDSALYVQEAQSVTITSSTFSENKALNGGAITLDGVQKGTIANTKFSNNIADTKGGGIYFVGGTKHGYDESIITGDTNVTLKNIAIDGCQVRDVRNYQSGGGGFFVDNNAEVVMEGGIVTKCSASSLKLGIGSAGGGIGIDGSGKLTIDGKAEISYNTAGSGGGIHSYGNPDNEENLVLKSAHIHHNTATTSEGGGIFTNNNTPLTLNNAVIRNNECSIQGGGIWTCQLGIPLVFEKDGLAVFDNVSADNKAINNGYEGSARDVFVYSVQGFDEKKVTFSEIMLGGGEFNWYNDDYFARFDEVYGGGVRKPADPVVYTNRILNGANGGSSINLESRPTSLAKDEALKKATVIIENNKAVKGGGIALNGPTISGEKYPEKSLTVKKEWTGDKNSNQPSSVKIQLYRYDDSNHKIAIGDPVVLDESNHWQHVFDGLSTAYTWTADEIDTPVEYIKHVNTSADGYTITIQNYYQKDRLLITKKIAEKNNEGVNITPDTSAEFEFKVTIGNDSDREYHYRIDDQIYTMKSTEYISLKHNQTAEFLDIPKGTNYKVEEKDYYNHTIQDKNYITSSKNALGYVHENVEATFVNTEVSLKYPETISSLVVVDRIIAHPEDIDYNKFFDVHIKIGDDANKQYKYQIVTEEEYAYYNRNDPRPDLMDMEQNSGNNSDTNTQNHFPVDDSFIPGIAVMQSNSNEFHLKMNHGMALIIYGIPVGTHYSIYQSDYDDGYKIDSSVKTNGIILPDKEYLDDPDTVDHKLLRVRADIFNYFTRPIQYTIEVEKQWVSTGTKIPKSTVIHMDVDGKEFDSRTLKASEDWKSSFTFTKEDSADKFIESIREDEVEGFKASYEYVGTTVNGDKITRQWKIINTEIKQDKPNVDKPSEDKPNINIPDKNKPEINEIEKPNEGVTSHPDKNSTDTGDMTLVELYVVLAILVMGIIFIVKKQNKDIK